MLGPEGGNFGCDGRKRGRPTLALERNFPPELFQTHLKDELKGTKFYFNIFF